MLAGFNIWTKQLSPRTVAALAQEPGTESGDALAWHILKTGIMGNVEIYHNYDFQLKGLSRKKDLKQLQRQRKWEHHNRVNSKGIALHACYNNCFICLPCSAKLWTAWDDQIETFLENFIRHDGDCLIFIIFLNLKATPTNSCIFWIVPRFIAQVEKVGSWTATSFKSYKFFIFKCRSHCRCRQGCLESLIP